MNDLNCKVLADIGTDHGHLPLFIAEKRPEMKIFAIDLSEVAINALKTKVSSETKITLKRGYGFNPIPLEEIDICVLAGLGNHKILQILKLNDWRKKTYIFQAKENPILIRKWIKEKRYFILKETIVFENNHYYHTIFVSKDQGKKVLNNLDLMFGVYQRHEQDPVFKKYWTEQLKFKKDIINEVPDNLRTKIIFDEIDVIQTVLKHD